MRCRVGGARYRVPALRDPAAPYREFLLVEAEGRGWHSVRMRRWNDTRADCGNFLFEELCDYDDDPHLYNGRANTPREQGHVDMLRERLLTMRTAASDELERWRPTCSISPDHEVYLLQFRV
jgi:hypothetical protein